MSSDRKRRNWSTHVEPHVCRHLTTMDPDGPLIEWCICPLDEDHVWDDLRIEPHECVTDPNKKGKPGDLGWWQNPVTQTLRGES